MYMFIAGEVASAPANIAMWCVMETICENEQLAERMGMLWRGSPETSALIGLLGPIMRVIAEGRPATVAEVAAAVGRPADQMWRALRRFSGADWTGDERLTGLAITLQPTLHRLSVSGRDLYGACAVDALMAPAVLSQLVSVESPCRVTGAVVRIAATPAHIVTVEPATAVVTVLARPEKATARQSSICPYQLMFRDADVASWWLTRHPGYRALSVTDAFGYARRLAGIVCW